MTDFIRRGRDPELVPQLDLLEAGETRSSWDNLLYFAARHYFSGPEMTAEREKRAEEERAMGIYHLEPAGAIDVGIQVIELAKLDPATWDKPGAVRRRRAGAGTGWIRSADVGRDHRQHQLPARVRGVPHLFSQIAMATDQLQGVYVLGKAATLNGRIGDVMLANVVYDEHSGNTYWFDNCFAYDDIAPYLVFGAALDNQRAVTVKGTYLQNEGYLDFYYRENFTVVEMEAGPYLSAIYEETSLSRYPDGRGAQHAVRSARHLDLGIIHYASDTPYTRAQTLGARGMSFFGMDSTYASTIAILRRVFEREASGLTP